MLRIDDNNFTCYQDDSPKHGNLPLDVQVGDVLGACGTDDDKQLDIFGDSEAANGQPLLRISKHHFSGGCKKNKIPSMVTLNSNGEGVNVSRVLHLYAYISMFLLLYLYHSIRNNDSLCMHAGTSITTSTTLISVITKVTNITSQPSIGLSNIPSTVIPSSSAVQSEQSTLTTSKVVPSPTMISRISSIVEPTYKVTSSLTRIRYVSYSKQLLGMGVTTANQPDPSLVYSIAMGQSLIITSEHKLSAIVLSTIHQPSRVQSVMKPTPTLTATDAGRGDDSSNKLENLKLRTSQSEINVTSAVYNFSSVLSDLENGQIVERTFSEVVKMLCYIILLLCKHSFTVRLLICEQFVGDHKKTFRKPKIRKFIEP